MSEEKCENCRYWRKVDPEDDGDLAECRLRGPQLSQNGEDTAVWPLSHKADWCGEWKAKP